MTVKCGKCIECQQAASQEWAVRIMLEARQHSHSCCLTLTYDNVHVSSNYSLCRRDIQLFLKKLRKALSPLKIRYFYSGEYGEKYGRPHFHMIVFGWRPHDLVLHFMKKQNRYFSSAFTQKIWGKGMVCVGDLDYRTAVYCAKYLQKFSAPGREPRPFIGMSNRPGIGFNSIKPEMLFDGCFYYDGRKIPLPRYFQKVLERDADPIDIAMLRGTRKAILEQSIRIRSDDTLQRKRKKEKEFLGKESWEFFVENT